MLVVVALAARMHYLLFAMFPAAVTTTLIICGVAAPMISSICGAAATMLSVCGAAATTTTSSSWAL
jgi:hypothetical protein